MDNDHDASFASAARLAARQAWGQLAKARGRHPMSLRAASLRRSVEYAMRSVLLSWRRPAANADKLWSAIALIGPRLDPEVALWTQQVRRCDVRSVPLLLSGADAGLTAILHLATAEPPAGWPPADHVGRLHWVHLPATDRQFLLAALDAARGHVPSAGMWLYGSRAKGCAAADSDHDLLLVVPDGTPNRSRWNALAAVRSAAATYGVTVDPQWMAQSVFEDPDPEGDTLLCFEVRAYGMEVPSLPAADARVARRLADVPELPLASGTRPTGSTGSPTRRWA
jgi:hypothetical protein